MVRSGLSAEELFVRGIGITYDGFDLLGTQFSTITKQDVSLRTSLGKGIELAVPIMASPMDSVVSPEMAIAMAQLGGIAVIHYNHKDAEGRPSIPKQVEDISRVKRYQAGFIENPIVVAPEMTISRVLEIAEANKVGGNLINTFPVTQNGKSNGTLVGLLREDDYFPGERLDCLVRDRMLDMEKLITGKSGITLEQAKEILWEKRIKSLPIVDEKGNLAYLVTRRDIEKRFDFPDSTIDENGRLRVLFAVSTWPESYERVKEGFKAGADGVVVDTSQGYTKLAIDMLEHIAKNYPDKLLIGGNISTAEAARALAQRGFVDAYRCGQGSGSICTTAKVIGIGRANATAVYECAKADREDIGSGIVAIADGGLKETGDIFKALGLGAGAVMLGGMLAGHKECPGEVVYDERGVPVKQYWGMGSKKANVGGDERIRGYGRHEEGIVTIIPFRGSIHDSFPSMIDALRHSFASMNCRDIKKLQNGVRNKEIRFEKHG